MANDAWMEVCLIGISKIGEEEVQFASKTETADFDIGEKDLEGLALTNGGRITVWKPEGDTTITFEAYPLEAGSGEGFSDLMHGDRAIMRSAATSTTANKLVDTNGDFSNRGIAVGNKITNITDTTYAVVTAIDSATQLSISGDIMTSGEVYTIKDSITVVAGATTSTTANKLVDSSENFTNRAVATGDKVRNTTDNTTAVVTAIDNTTTLSISSDIMTSGEDYIITEAPIRVINSRVRTKHRLLALYTDKASVKAGEAIANSYNALRIGFGDVRITKIAPGFTDGNLKFTITFKCVAFDKSGAGNIMLESCAAGGGSDALPVIADYTTSNKFG
jgi:hypothetical protein